MYNTLIIFGMLCIAVFISASALKAQSPIKVTKAPVVVELFTSQSCSSCPPADRILSELAKHDNVIALGCHVEYWNHLHWKDTLSHDFCDMRQHGYSAIDGSKRVYTPQMVVNGSEKFVGSQQSKLKNALNKAERAPIKNIEITQNADNTISFILPNADNANYRLWAFGYKTQEFQDIKRGENSGLSHTYANPVSTYTNLGAWHGQAAQHNFERPSNDIDGIAILAQRDGYGQIIAAGKYNFR